MKEWFARERNRLIADAVLVACVLAFALLFFVIFRATGDGGELVRVSVGGELFAEYPLSEDGEYSLNGGTNVLVIKDGAAWISYADCPDGICVKSGKISLAGERIVCLPNRVMVEVVGEGELDFVS